MLVIGSRQMRNQKLEDKMFNHMDGKDVVETDSEKLLGVVINNELRWKNHLYGDNENEGLIPKLSQRVEIINKNEQAQTETFRFRIFLLKTELLSSCFWECAWPG